MKTAMKKEIQDALRKQPKTTKERGGIPRKVQPPAKDSGQKASSPAKAKKE